MRVAFDLTIPARAITGVGVYARQLLSHLRRRDLEIVAWEHPMGPSGGGRARVANALRLLAWLERQVACRVRREGVTVYHAATSIGPLRTPCPRVMTVHDATLLTMRSQYGRLDRFYHRIFSVLAARRAAAVIVHSQVAREDVARVYRIPPGRLYAVPLGVSPAFRPVPKVERSAVLEHYGLCRPYVLVVGAEPPRKNLARLIEAYARLPRRGPARAAELVLVGPPEPIDGTVDGLVTRLGLDGRVRRLGPVARDELPAIYSGAACLAYPSLAEGFGLPVLEAMACGTPVLTSKRSSMAEVAGDAALLVDPRCVGAIAEGLLRLVEDGPFVADLVARGRARAAAFTWERTAEATEAVYRRVARGDRGPTHSPTRESPFRARSVSD